MARVPPLLDEAEEFLGISQRHERRDALGDRVQKS
jgi:hypothetical protein